LLGVRFLKGASVTRLAVTGTCEKGTGEMYSDWYYAVVEQRQARELELAERWRLMRLAGKRSIRARVARSLMALALAAEANEVRRAFRERPAAGA
jgi:hypothetical protein